MNGGVTMRFGSGFGVTVEASVPEIEKVTVAKSGFSLHDKNGKFVAYEEHMDDALASMREYDAAEFVVRVEDGVVLAKKLRHKLKPSWSPLWPDRRAS